METVNNSSFPQVLLLGNGVNRAFGGVSWEQLINDIKVRDDINPETLKEKNIPFPMQAILVTNDDLKTALNENKERFWGEIRTPEQMEILQNLLKMGFSDILTTNYSYELEAAAVNKPTISKYCLQQMSKSTCGRAETQYLLHTYNQVDYQNSHNRIWHIHGESRKQNSMILGHYWYANQLARMKKESDDSKNAYQQYQLAGRTKAIDSWIDAFILGDVYILGFGFDLSEIDMWWLLNRKQREKAAHGKVYYYDVQNIAQYEKVELLKLMGAEPIDFGIEKPEENNPDGGTVYREFYRKALEDISRKMRG